MCICTSLFIPEARDGHEVVVLARNFDAFWKGRDYLLKIALVANTPRQFNGTVINTRILLLQLLEQVLGFQYIFICFHWVSR
jgi:hypothetical protein